MASFLQSRPVGYKLSNKSQGVRNPDPTISAQTGYDISTQLFPTPLFLMHLSSFMSSQCNGGLKASNNVVIIHKSSAFCHNPDPDPDHDDHDNDQE